LTDSFQHKRNFLCYIMVDSEITIVDLYAIYI
jgi:hypothetical protein